MESLVAALPALGCLVMMPAMMWLIARGMRSHDTPDAQPHETNRAHNEELTRLRDEVAQLRGEIDTDSRSSEPAGG